MSQNQPNPEQLKIINHRNGALLILAPVGTGKTRVLSSRVVNAIKQGIPPEKILCLTFANRAAKEMKERLAQMCPQQFRYITTKTFHSLCTSILRIEAKNIGLPADLLGNILIESGLYDYDEYHQPQRLENLKRLVKIFKEQDNLELHPDTALRNILEYTALAKNLDQISQENNQVLIITIHQSRGLEFDHIFIAGMCEQEFPSYFSLRSNKLEEEKRLFYVALTRAKKQLFISWFLKNDKNEPKSKSQFINSLPAEYLIETTFSSS